MGGACNTYGGEAHLGILRGNLRERENLEDANVDGSIILRSIFMEVG